MNKDLFIELGSYIQESSKVIVADPIFKNDSMFTITINNIAKGVWNAILIQAYRKDSKDYINGELICLHESIKKDLRSIDKLKWKYYGDFTSETRVNVVFDLKYYKKYLLGPNYDKWFNKLENIILTPNNFAGVIPFGAVSDSNFEDGIYDVNVVKVNDKIVGIKIEFA